MVRIERPPAALDRTIAQMKPAWEVMLDRPAIPEPKSEVWGEADPWWRTQMGAVSFLFSFLVVAIIGVETATRRFETIAFEFRYRSERMRPIWDRGFFLGSVVVAFAQGAAVGAMIRGIPVANGQYAGGPFGWLHPFAILTGIGLVLGYALLGAGWLVLKSDGELRDWAHRRIRWLTITVFGVLFVAFTATFDYSILARSNLLVRPWALAFPGIALLALAGILLGARRDRDYLPFAMTCLFFLAAFISLGLMFWPYMIPYSVTVASAAAPDASLRFLFYGGVVVLPVIAAYTIGVYWVFRGKIGKVAGNP
jgi:cytochrome bd ubiquinol oxidase subunit II